jgi:6-phospho-beta-glucosidase
MNNYNFPKGFYWGSASSAEQAEGAAHVGGKAKTIWQHWHEIEPGRFFDGIGPQDTSGFYHNYKEDIKLMKQIGHNSFRTSISWARLMPNGNVNQEGVSFYNGLIDELIANGIEPFINLFHFDMPMDMQQIGGFSNRAVVDSYVSYAIVCFELFGDRVKKWFTHNEPIVPAEGGYLYDFHYPNELDFKKAVQVSFNTLLSSAKAIEAYRNCGQDGKIGIILNLTPSYPRSSHPADLSASVLADGLFNRSFLDTSVKGVFPKDIVEFIEEEGLMPEYEDSDLNTIKNNTIDILGINYYQPRRVKAKEHLPHPKSPLTPEHYFDNYIMPGRKLNKHRGWEIYEKGVYDLLINIKDNYSNIDCFISENGMGVEDEERFRDEDGVIQDDYRIDFIREHLKWVHKAIVEGVNVKGYHLWTFIDNWSWTNAYKNRYGFVSLNLNKNGERTIKKSGMWIKEVAGKNGFKEA